MDHATASAAEIARSALQSDDLTALAALAHPTRGVTVSHDAFLEPADPVLSHDRLRDADGDPTRVQWGHADGTGDPVVATVAERLEEIAGSTALTSTSEVGFDVRIGVSNTVDNLGEWFPGDHFVEYHHRGSTEDIDGRSVRFAFDTSEGEPSLVGIVEDSWTI